MDLSENPRLERLRVKSRARGTLNVKGAVLALLLGSLVLVTAIFALEACERAVYYFLVSGNRSLERSAFFIGILTTVFDLATCLAVAPLILGLYRIAAGVVHGGVADLRELLYYLHPRKYFRSVVVYVLVVEPWHIYGLAVTALYQALPLMFDSVGNTTAAAYSLWIAKLGVFFAVLVLGSLLAIGYCRFYSVIAAVVCGEGHSVFSCIAAALRATRQRAWRILTFRLSFIPVILLGLVSVGIILFIFTVPYMLISYFHYNAELFGAETEDARTTEVTFDER